MQHSGNYVAGSEPIEGYRLIEHLGRGTFGEVWKALDVRTAKLVALKVIDLSYSTNALKELTALNLVKNLNHPHLIPILTACLKDTSGRELALDRATDAIRNGQLRELVIAMGLGDKSLARRIKERNPPGTSRADVRGIPADELIGYFYGAAKGIDYLNKPDHGLGRGDGSIIHCDIKPDNLLVVSGELQIADCGVAVILNPDVRNTRTIGSPAYMAPELIGGTPRRGTDQYALAVTYYELRVGHLPFDEHRLQVYSLLLTHAEGRLDFSSPILTAGERQVLRWATALQVDDRYPTCLDMVKQLERAVEGLSPVEPRAVPTKATPISDWVSGLPPPFQGDGPPADGRDTVPLAGHAAPPPDPAGVTDPMFDAPAGMALGDDIRDTYIPESSYILPFAANDGAAFPTEDSAADLPSVPEILIPSGDEPTLAAIALPDDGPATAAPAVEPPVPDTTTPAAAEATDVIPPQRGPKVVSPGASTSGLSLPGSTLEPPKAPRPEFEWTSITGVPRPRTPSGNLIAHQVFVSYRRGDTDDITNRMIEYMGRHFAKGVIFFDLDAIQLGYDFRDVIRRAVASCKVFMAVIGKDWLTIQDEDGQRRIDDPLDFVRLEIEAALLRHIPVIPVLVRQARMPKEKHLPETMRPLAFRHGMEVRSSNRDFPHDMQYLIAKLTEYLNG